MSARAGQPEVLAPAGSPAALDAALLCGADAVYFGVDVLNARRNAENFTLEHLADTVRRCHVRGVKGSGFPGRPLYSAFLYRFPS